MYMSVECYGERLRPGFSHGLGWKVFCSCLVQELPLFVPSLMSKKGRAPCRVLPKRLFKTFLEAFSATHFYGTCCNLHLRCSSMSSSGLPGAGLEFTLCPSSILLSQDVFGQGRQGQEEGLFQICNRRKSRDRNKRSGSWKST